MRTTPPLGQPDSTERGAALPLVALMLFVLMGLASFAVDLGWFYLHATRVQRAADAAALAGVIHMPHDFLGAEIDAVELAGVNGYIPGPGTDITVSPVPGEPSQLEVRISDTVPTFFLKVLGRNEQVIARTARAEFVPPLPLGSPSNQFGNSCDPAQTGCSNQPNFWANIHGRYTQRGMGDAYSTFCVSGSGNGCTGENPLHRDRGYLYGIEAPAGSSFTVQFTDMAFHNISGGVATGDNHRTGDRGCEDWGTNSALCGQTVITSLYAPDPDPLDVSNNTKLCEHRWTPRAQVAANAAYTAETPLSCFTINNASAGIYVLQVRIEEPTERRFSGLNRYGLRVTSPAKIYGLGDISIYNNFTGSVSEFYLAEVDETYRNKTFIVEMFDPGEGNGYVQLMAPNGAGWGMFSSCRMYTRSAGQMTGNWSDEGTRSPCQYQADNSSSAMNFNDRWVRLEVSIPETYSCGANCWWKVNYNYSGGVNDTTTWRAFVVGNPIHLVPVGG